MSRQPKDVATISRPSPGWRSVATFLSPHAKVRVSHVERSLTFPANQAGISVTGSGPTDNILLAARECSRQPGFSSSQRPPNGIVWQEGPSREQKTERKTSSGGAAGQGRTRGARNPDREAAVSISAWATVTEKYRS